MLKHIRGILKMVIWMKTISIIIGKILILIGKIVNKGSTLPGEYALKIDKNMYFNQHSNAVDLIFTVLDTGGNYIALE